MASGVLVLFALASAPSFATVVDGSITESVTTDETLVPVLQWHRGENGQLSGELVITLPETAADGDYALTARFAGGAVDTSWIQILDLVAG